MTRRTRFSSALLSVLLGALAATAGAKGKPLDDTVMTSAQIDALWSIDDPAAGFVKLQAALARHPGSADDLHTQICRSLGLQGKFDEGWTELAKVSAHPSDIVAVRVQLESGRLKNSSGDKSGAVPYFMKALELAKRGHFDYYAVDAAHMLGIATSGQESVDWNENALQMVAESQDNRARQWKGSLLNNLGWTYHNSGDYPRALTKFKEAQAFQEEKGGQIAIRISRWAVARCLRSLKRYEEALAILQELINFPELGYVSEEMGEDLLALGRIDEAKPHFKRAYELLSKDPSVEQARLQRLSDLSH